VVLCGSIGPGQSHREWTGRLIFSAEGEELDPAGQAGREKEAVKSKSGSEVFCLKTGACGGRRGEAGGAWCPQQGEHLAGRDGRAGRSGWSTG